MKNLNYLIIVALAILCIVLLHAKSATAVGAVQNGLGGAVPSIEVNASESRKFPADEFVVHALVAIAGVDKEDLFKQVEKRRKKIFGIAKELEIGEGDVQQNSVELRKQWAYHEGSRKFDHYEANQEFSVKIGDRQLAADLVQALSTEADIEVGRTTASLKNVELLQKSVVDAAGKKAMDKAYMYAGSVGAKLGKIISIGTGYNDGVMMDGAMMMNAAPMAKSARLGGSDMNAIADSVTLSAEIRLVVEIK